MMLTLFVVISLIGLYLLYLPRLLAKECRRDLVVFSLLMFITFVISFLASVGVKFPYISTEFMKILKLTFRIQ
jgi:hypothetical protein